MLRRIRNVLASEYIGAITIGFLLAQVAAGVASSIVEAVAFYVGEQRDRSNIYPHETHMFPWWNITLPLISIFLYLLAAGLLFYWLYLRPKMNEEAPFSNSEETAQK